MTGVYEKAFFKCKKVGPPLMGRFLLIIVCSRVWYSKRQREKNSKEEGVTLPDNLYKVKIQLSQLKADSK